MSHNHRITRSNHTLDDFRAVKASLSARLLPPLAGNASASSLASSTPADNVVGVGIGEKRADGKATGLMALKVLVKHKYPRGFLGASYEVPETIDGLDTDVEEVGTFQASKTLNVLAPELQISDPRTRMRPPCPGSSIGFLDPGDPANRNAGTFGALVTDGIQRYILSNNHVLAAEGRLSEGAKIVQPGTWEGGDPRYDLVAYFTRAVPLQTGAANEVDAAIAALTEIASPDVLAIGPPAGVGPASFGMPVHKFGRTSSYTTGQVTSVDTDVKVQFETGSLLFQEQIIIVGDNSWFSQQGDSGSLVLDRRTNCAVGLLFANSNTHTIANHLQKVLDALNVTLV